jgi:hypothetical protein
MGFMGRIGSGSFLGYTQMTNCAVRDRNGDVVLLLRPMDNENAFVIHRCLELFRLTEPYALIAVRLEAIIDDFEFVRDLSSIAQAPYTMDYDVTDTQAESWVELGLVTVKTVRMSNR